MDNWRTFVDYEMEYVDKETGEITYKIIGKTRAKRECRIIKNETRTEYNGNIKRIIYRCREHEQLRIF